MQFPTACGGRPVAPPLPALPGSQSIVNILLEHGVDTVFGYLGAAVLPLFDRFQDLSATSSLDRI
jgi:hypothetical protein